MVVSSVWAPAGNCRCLDEAIVVTCDSHELDFSKLKKNSISFFLDGSSLLLPGAVVVLTMLLCNSTSRSETFDAEQKISISLMNLVVGSV